MSIMDDIFDLREHLKDDPSMLEVLERVEDRLWHYETVYDIAIKLYNRRDDMKRAFEELEQKMEDCKPNVDH